MISFYRTYKSAILALLLLFFFNPLHAQNPKYEMRGIWIATVANIDWPSKPNLSTKEQKKEVLEILDHVAALKFNTVFFQIRPVADAFYQSELEPWSKYLTGESGKAPRPFYDPLEYWITEAHKRGLELHAWINPFRASNGSTDQLSPQHPVHKHAEWMVEYGGKSYFDPGYPQVRKYIANVVKDIITRYQVDGIHMDDYFYPYPIANKEFPDSLSFAKHGAAKQLSSKADWRRDNVNQTISLLHKTIKTIKPSVAFGVSPFGVWRNKTDDEQGSNTKAGITNYDHLYADVLTWLNNKWLDYINPQVYWEMDHPAASFDTIANWWNTHNYNTPVYIGHALYKINKSNEKWKDPHQIPAQIIKSRELKNIEGGVFFSYKHLNRPLLGLCDSLKQNYYHSAALSPIKFQSTQQQNSLLIKRIRHRGNTLKWKMNRKDKNKPLKFVVYHYQSPENSDTSNPDLIYTVTGENHIKIHKNKKNKSTHYFRVSIIDKYREESQVSAPIRIRM
ncbi:glycoside hydrolase family 10 protein [Marinilabiliaceae bacterium JC017]|nr:glycoside hydrolase family 10 protein [Marinilabiliaceae bacterium JC017]